MRCEAQAPAWALRQPVVDQLKFVSGGLVMHEMDVESPWHVRLDPIEKGAELDRTMAGRAAADRGPRLHVEDGEQVGRTLGWSRQIQP